VFILKNASDGSHLVKDAALIDIVLSKGVLAKGMALQWRDGMLSVRELGSLFSQAAVEVESGEDASSTKLAVQKALEHEFSELNRNLELQFPQVSEAAEDSRSTRPEELSYIFHTLDVFDLHGPIFSLPRLNEVEHARLLFSPQSSEPFHRMVGYEIRSGEIRSLMNRAMSRGSVVSLVLKKNR
jgi:hypothetical protein